MAGGPRVLVLARGVALDELASQLGDARRAALAELRVTRARRWADALARRLADGDADGGGGGVVRTLDAASPADAAAEVFDAAGAGPTVVVWPRLPVWRADVAAAALDDLAAGCAVVLGPVFQGGLYLLAFTEPLPALRTLPDDRWHGATALAAAFGAAHGAPREIGLLRAERGLSRPDDVRALLADPLTDGELRALLA